jgi:hypothetical protein
LEGWIKRWFPEGVKNVRGSVSGCSNRDDPFFGRLWGESKGSKRAGLNKVIGQKSCLLRFVLLQICHKKYKNCPTACFAVFSMAPFGSIFPPKSHYKGKTKKGKTREKNASFYPF